MIRIELQNLVDAPVQRVFDASLSVELHLQSMALRREKVVAGRVRGQFEQGEKVTWRAWHFGLPWRMTNEISQVRRPTRFTDRQVRGPFAHFHHEHLFEARGTKTLMRDIVTFAAPCGPLGRAVERLLLGRYLRQLLEQRNQEIIRQLNG